MADPNILMGIKTAQFINPLDAAAQAAQVKRANLQNAMFQQEADTQSKLDKAYQLAGGDVNKMQADPSIGYKAGMEINSLKATQAQNAFKAQNEKLDYLLKQSEYSAQQASGVKDQAGWDRVRNHVLQTLGPDAAAHMPEQFSEDAKQQLIDGAMSFKDRIAQQRADQQSMQQDRMYNATMERIAASERNAAQRSDGGNGEARYNTIYDTQGKAFFVNPKDPTAPPIPIKTETGDQFAKPPAPTKAFTQDQSKAAIYGKRIEQAASILDDIGSDYNPTSIAVKGTLEDAPLVGKYAGMYANEKIDPKSRQVEQAQLNILNAILRQESGATIGSPEFKKAEKQYFIVPGDDEQTKANKRQNLQTVIAGMKNESGPAWLTDEKVDASNQNSVITHPKHGEITEDDIQTTMKARNMTREQVLQKLGVQ